MSAHEDFDAAPAAVVVGEIPAPVDQPHESPPARRSKIRQRVREREQQRRERNRQREREMWRAIRNERERARGAHKLVGVFR